MDTQMWSWEQLSQITRIFNSTYFSNSLVCHLTLMSFAPIQISLAVGAVPSPFDCYLVNRGLKTLHVRMRAHYENALAIAKYLEANERVDKVCLT